ncbi:hypothetical protein, variant 2 [Blastomyces dermatitidis ER-3]|uniref:Uncharacterized protein n=1 Tax=Ajellomyces dermatitidis (strain ER-3 / ATCC MYA-2586) TaxID=559297 RepID=A0ABX2VYZ9_AJEDR|nr:uncharacterized protein BDCG_07366 [Blastomyces dermatitidis ER-3]XP_045282095.1 hypothetical protein, variant 1 [Blastomyces dermatitidis ER-3]XP_045282096.1 hypothetical protein, variant 2 [Blastomyces dermatitidis ER-3]OAT02367.1 hypothetical protein BDCG_07366 [Blastomyces dermatitidis ER-3]OAT02368.1 hypothetical protein, variant 1 [Blastomyces dermatitidis ER-3]OAT02369.1 hypothetical protein, variant 2 [Blastomyces dermatitidis ER-3]
MKLSIHDLEKLTAKDLEGVLWLEPVEGEEWTEEHKKKLKELVDARGQDYRLDATALGEKLRNLSSTDARRRSASTESKTTASFLTHTPSPDPEMEAIRAKHRAENLEDYNYLIQQGGRPAFPLELAQAQTNDFGEHLDMVEYWGQRYRGQRNQWVVFLTHQMRKRRSVKVFTKYQQTVHDYREKEGIEGSIQLHFDEKQQSKIDTWKEYHYHEHKFLLPRREKAEAARKQREKDIADWEAGKRNPQIPENMGWIHYVRALEESDLEKDLGWLRWIESEFPKIEQECAIGLDKTPRPAEAEAETKEPATLPSSHIEIEPPSAGKSLRRSQRSASGTTKSLVGSPRVSSRRKANPAVPAKYLSHAHLGTASLAPPSQSSTLAKPATRRDMIPNESRMARSVPIAETGSLRRSQRIIEMESRKTQQQAAQEAARQSETAPKIESRRDLRTLSRKKSSKPTSLHSKPQGITKAQSSRKRKLVPAAKKTALALRDDQQQAAQETPKSSRTATRETTGKKESRSQSSREKNVRAAPPQSRPQGVKKPQAPPKGRRSRGLKITALAREVTV